MKLVLLEINNSLRNLIKYDSLLNNFPNVVLFYFSIPTNITIADQNHLVKQGFLFFQSQFSENINSHIFVVNKKDVRNKIKIAKELSWEIFFHFNKWVKVCSGVFDEGLDWFISSFKGKIIDFYSNDGGSVFLIAFSGNSLLKIPLELLNTNINNKIPAFHTFLGPELIMPDSEPDNKNEDEKQRIELMLKLKNYTYCSSGEKFKSFSDLLQCWKDQFKEKFVSRVKVRINSSDRSIYHLIDIPYFDERFGVWCTLESSEKIIDIPIMEILEIEDNKVLINLVMEYQKIMTGLLPN